MFQTGRENFVVPGGDMIENSLGRSPTPDQRGTQDLAGATTGSLPLPVPGEESRGKRRVNKPSFHLKSYPWYVADWRMSETRLRLSPVGRYIYRELIDHCYNEGSLPHDEAVLARIVDVPLKDFRREWPSVKRSFSEGNDGRLHNQKVDEILPGLERWHEQKRVAGQAGGIARAIATAKRTPNGRHDSAQALLKPSTSTSTSTSTSIPPTPVDELCADFIQAYPIEKRTKIGAVERWYAANVGMCLEPGKLHAEIMAGLARAKCSAAWEKSDGRYVCGMLAFLEDSRWREEWPESEGWRETPLTNLEDLE